MEDKNKTEQQTTQEKSIHDEIKTVVEDKIKKLIETGIQSGNIDYFSKLVDIHKDIENEKYWEVKKEVLENDVR